MTKTKESTVYIKVPTETKARWVKKSQAAGMKLTDWIVAAVEGQLLAEPDSRPEPISAEQIAEQHGENREE